MVADLACFLLLFSQRKGFQQLQGNQKVILRTKKRNIKNTKTEVKRRTRSIKNTSTGIKIEVRIKTGTRRRIRMGAMTLIQGNIMRR